jgi:hypothetical protein
LVAQQLERAPLVDRVALHEDPFGALDHGAPAEGALEALKLGEAAQDDTGAVRDFLAQSGVAA